MPPLRLPDSPDDEMPKGDMLFGLEGLLPLDADELQKLGLDDLPEPDWEALGIKLRDPAKPLTPPPGSVTHQTTDGMVFWFHHRIADEPLPIQIDVVTPEDSVGYARIGRFEDGVLTLADIRLEPSHRCRGMGSALVRHVIDLAREHRLQRVYGFVVERDYQAMPHLLHWYARLGFTITPATDEDRAQPHQGDAVALLDLKLSA